MHPHATGDVRENFMATIELDPKRRTGQGFENLTLYSNHLLLSHILYKRTCLGLFTIQKERWSNVGTNQSSIVRFGGIPTLFKLARQLF